MKPGRNKQVADKGKLLDAVGFRLKVLRTEADLSQGELAALMSITRGGIANMEAGKINIGVATLARLAENLGSNLKEFIKGIKP